MGSLLALNAVIIGIQVVPWWWGWCKSPKVPYGRLRPSLPLQTENMQNLQIKSSLKEEHSFHSKSLQSSSSKLKQKRSEKKPIPTRILHETYPFATYADLFPLTKISQNVPKSPPIAPLHSHWSPVRIWFPKIQVHGLGISTGVDADIAKWVGVAPWYMYIFFSMNI